MYIALKESCFVDYVQYSVVQFDEQFYNSDKGNTRFNLKNKGWAVKTLESKRKGIFRLFFRAVYYQYFCP